MVMVATTSFFHQNSFTHHGMTFNKLGGTQVTMYVCGLINTKYPSFWQVKATPATKVGVTDSGTITAPFLTPKMMLDPNKKLPNMVSNLGSGRMVQDGFVFRQKFYIRSYEIGPDGTASLETLMNHLQETSLNHLMTIGLLCDDLGSTPEMCKKNLIWVMASMKVVVDHYPTWGDVVQIDTWKSASGKNGMCCNWMFFDCKTGEMLIRASSIFVMMNKETRRLSKFPDEVRAELEQYFMDTPPIVIDDARKWSKRDDRSIFDHVQNGLTPRWSDLDINQHVNNVKYIGWIVEGVPKPILEKYELASMALEYCRECTKDNVLQSHTCILGNDNIGGIADSDHVDCQHLLRLQIGGGGDVGGGGGGEILKGRTRWRPK